MPDLADAENGSESAVEAPTGPPEGQPAGQTSGEPNNGDQPPSDLAAELATATAELNALKAETLRQELTAGLPEQVARLVTGQTPAEVQSSAVLVQAVYDAATKGSALRGAPVASLRSASEAPNPNAPTTARELARLLTAPKPY